jgi:hypothetical protein
MEVQTEAGTALKRDTYGYEVSVYATGTDGRRIGAANQRWHETAHIEGTQTPAITREEWTYDAFGNVLKHTEWGVVEGSNLRAGADERITRFEYVNDTSKWLLRKETWKLVTDAEGKRLSETRSYYDGEPFVGLGHGQVGTRGVVTRVEDWVEGGRYVQTQRLSHDGYGVVVASLNPVGTRTETEFDARTHRLPIAERVFLASGPLSMSHSGPRRTPS